MLSSPPFSISDIGLTDFTLRLTITFNTFSDQSVALTHPVLVLRGAGLKDGEPLISETREEVLVSGLGKMLTDSNLKDERIERILANLREKYGSVEKIRMEEMDQLLECERKYHNLLASKLG